MTPDQIAKFDRFKALHEGPGAFVIPNPWDAGSARILTALGFAALATTSAGLAFSLGLEDSPRAIGRDATIANAAAIAAATPLPVSADLQQGFGPAPEDCAETISQAIAAGLVGGSIEDATDDLANPIFAFDAAVARIRAAVQAAQGQPFVLTARAENYLHARRDLPDTIRRLQAYAEAGADVLFAPGLPDLDAIRLVCQSVNKPVNVVMGLQGQTFTVDDLAAAGVKRISTGGSLARAALGALAHAAAEIRDIGTFTYAARALPGKLTGRLTSRPVVPPAQDP